MSIFLYNPMVTNAYVWLSLPETTPQQGMAYSMLHLVTIFKRFYFGSHVKLASTALTLLELG